MTDAQIPILHISLDNSLILPSLISNTFNLCQTHATIVAAMSGTPDQLESLRNVNAHLQDMLANTQFVNALSITQLSTLTSYRASFTTFLS